MPRIGMRTVKTAMAVTACLFAFMGLSYLGQLLIYWDFLPGFGLFLTKQEPAFGCVAAIICMQPTLETSLRNGAYRLLGTAAGGAVGMLFLWINHITLDGRLHILWIIVGIIIAIWLILLIKKPDAGGICAVTLVIVMLTVDRDSQFIYALNRIIGTAIGIGVSVAVNRFVKPPKSTQE